MRNANARSTAVVNASNLPGLSTKKCASYLCVRASQLKFILTNLKRDMIAEKADRMPEKECQMGSGYLFSPGSYMSSKDKMEKKAAMYFLKALGGLTTLCQHAFVSWRLYEKTPEEKECVFLGGRGKTPRPVRMYRPI